MNQSAAPNAAPEVLNHSRIADITNRFSEAKNPLSRPDELKAGDFDRTTAAIDTDTSYAGKGGGALRPISDNFTVNPANGTLSLSFPIATSTTRSNFGPNLKIAYDSGYGNGVFGIGWKLMGPESISRRTSKAIPKFNDTDLFVLTNTQDLIPALLQDGQSIDESERDGYVVRQYRPRVETDVKRIERWTHSTDPNEIHWRTISSANVVTLFGDDDESRIFETKSDGKKNILTWLASYAYDPFGNAIEYKYKKENGIGAGSHVWERSRSEQIRSRNRHLKSIRYGNRRPHRDLSTWEFNKLPDEPWMFEVVFDYGEHDCDYPTPTEVHSWPVRTDPFSNCKGGFEYRNYRICRRILCFHHFGPETIDYPVSSMSFSYTESSMGSFLNSMVFSTYELSGLKKLNVMSLPPHTFKYSEMTSVKRLELKTADTMTIETLSDEKAKWLDLDGEGAPGLLIEHRQAAWSYQRNESPLYSRSDGPKLGKTQWITSQPSFKNSEQHRFEDLDGNGALDIVYQDQAAGYSGYSERRKKIWSEFTAFTNNSTAPDLFEEARRVDLTGSGSADLLSICEETNEILWQESHRKKGFGPVMRVKRQPNGPTLVTSETTGQVYMADMTGDGMIDIVHISAGRISYWPNQGYGKFGSEVTMGNPPKFDIYDQFNHQRLRLGDVDGSGTTDLIYLTREGGLKVFLNLAGNQWSPPQKNPRFPKMNNLASVFTMDLLGNGTSCLCWTGPSISSLSNSSLHYFDFSGGNKCHLLVEASNGFGSSVLFSYRPSTWFYLNDEKDGQPWTTTLSFPVHCVQQVARVDHISQTKQQTTYAYHDGYYDGVEREFGGFGMVESWDSELLAVTGAKPFQRPQIHTKLWFHTGASNEASDESISYQSHPPRLSSSSLPDIESMVASEAKEACRALRGLQIRKEVYSQNYSDPYVTVDTRYSIERSQMRGPQDYGVFKTCPRETLSSYYERQSSEPRVVHDITLQVNDFGETAKAVSIAYGIPKSGLEDIRDKSAQETTYMIYYEREFTNAITHEADAFRKPLLATSRTYNIRGFNERRLFSRYELTENDFAFLKNANEMSIEKSHEPVAFLQKVRTAERKVYYRSSDLSQRLEHGIMETFSIVDQQYDLAFTKQLFDNTYGDISNFTGESFQHWIAKGGWAELKKDKDRWWQPSVRSRFHPSFTGAMELEAARKSFYMPSISLDPFDSPTTVQMDEYHLFPLSITDAMGGVTRASYNYAHLRPVELIDINKNRTEMALDGFGRVIGIATMGKADENVGDSFEGFQSHLDTSQLSDFLQNPTLASGLSFLKKAGKRRIMVHDRWHQSRGLPNLEIEITRTQHHGEQPRSMPTIMLKIDYLNGSGDTVQTVTLSSIDANGKPTQWHYSEWKDLDSKDQPVRQFRPAFAATHEFIPRNNSSSPTTTLLYDPLDRQVGILNADHTWRKTRNMPWATHFYDEGNTLLSPDLSTDPDVGSFVQSLDTSLYLPSWIESRRDLSVCDRWEIDCADKSKPFHDKPWIFHLDPLGRAISAVTHDGKKELCMRQEFDVAGNRSVSYDKGGREVDRQVFDLVGNCIYLKNMDAGEKWFLSDCNGQSLVSWNRRPICKIRVYDKLRRITENRVWMPDRNFLAIKTIYGAATDPQVVESNRVGRIMEIKDQAGTHENVRYDFKGNCIRTHTRLTMEHDKDIDWSFKVLMRSEEPFVSLTKFDALNRPLQSTNALGNITSRTYNLMGLLYSCSWRESLIEPETSTMARKTYNSDGLPTEICYGNGTRTSFAYDEQTKRLRRKTTFHSRSSTRPVISDLEYTYDCQGRITHITDVTKEVVHFRNTAVDASKDYTYDVQGRLVRAEGRECLDFNNNGGECLLPYDRPDAMGLEKKPSDSNQICRYAEIYTYDDVDNIRSMKHVALGVNISGWTRNYHYEMDDYGDIPKNNRLLRVEINEKTSCYGYDGPEGLTGCITSMPGYSHIGWDFDDKMRCSAKQKTTKTLPETTWYIYDSNGSRIRKVTENSVTGQVRKTKETIFIGDLEIYKTYESDGTTVRTTKTTANITGDKRIALVESDNLSDGSKFLLRYLVGDSLELDDQGNIISQEEYTPFGVTTYIACGQFIKAPSKYRYNSYERDSETGLYFCHARYYSPWLGRWMSPDPVGTSDGHNIYCYVSNDPVNYNDPGGTTKGTGMEMEEDQSTIVDYWDPTQAIPNTQDMDTLPIDGFQSSMPLTQLLNTFEQQQDQGEGQAMNAMEEIDEGQGDQAEAVQVPRRPFLNQAPAQGPQDLESLFTDDWLIGERVDHNYQHNNTIANYWNSDRFVRDCDMVRTPQTQEVDNREPSALEAALQANPEHAQFRADIFPSHLDDLARDGPVGDTGLNYWTDGYTRQEWPQVQAAINIWRRNLPGDDNYSPNRPQPDDNLSEPEEYCFEINGEEQYYTREQVEEFYSLAGIKRE